MTETKTKDGSTIKETKNTDGSSEKITTEKDGKLITEVKKIDGTSEKLTVEASGKSIKETVDADGKKTTVTTEKKEDGTIVTTTVKPDGTTVIEDNSSNDAEDQPDASEDTGNQPDDTGNQPDDTGDQPDDTKGEGGDDGRPDNTTPDPDDGDEPINPPPVVNNLIPVIKIKTTNPRNPESPLDFVTQPISDTVKLHSNTWGDYSKDSAPAPWEEVCTVTVTDSTGTETLKDVNAGVKVRGNWTTAYAKKGLRIKFEKKQNILGLHNGEKYKKWVLTASWKDFSMLRDYSAYYLSRLMDSRYYATDFKLVEVYINDEYWGVYLLVEQQESKRIGITESVENDGVTSTGYLLEYDGYTSIIKGKSINGTPVEQDFIEIDEYGTYTDINGENNLLNSKSGNRGYTLKSDYDDAKKAFAKNYMQTVWDICREAIENNTYYEFNSTYSDKVPSSATSAEECIAKVIDIDSLVNTFIVQELACDLDLNWSSFYMDFDVATNKKLTFEAPWDFDSSFGNHRERQIGNNGISHLVSVTDKEPCDGNPWTIIFAKESWFQNKVRAKWSEMSGLKSQLISEINRISNDTNHKEAFARNYEKWNNIGKPVGDELTPAAENCTTQRQAADYLISYINQRWSMLDRDFQNFKSSNVPVTDKATKTTTYDVDGQNCEVTLTVEAKSDGLHITKQHDTTALPRTRIYVRDETIGVDLFRVEDVDKRDGDRTVHNDVVYPFVQNGHEYTVKLLQWNADWQGNYSLSVKVKATGGLGNIYIKHGNYTYNSVENTIVFDSYEEKLDAIDDYNNLDKRIGHLFASDGNWEDIIDGNWGGHWRMNGNTMEFVLRENNEWKKRNWTETTPLPENLFVVVRYEYDLGDTKFMEEPVYATVYRQQ